MASYVPPKINTAFEFYVSLEDQANAGLFKASPTLAAGDVKVATGDGAPANLATLPVVDADFTKRVKVSLSAGEMNGDNVTVIFSDAAGAEWYDLTVNLQTTASQIDDLATSVALATVDGIVDDILEDTGTTLPAQISLISGGAGSGALSVTVTVNDENSLPLDGVECWITTDSAGTNVVAGTLSTSALGVVTFMLDAGAYYLWRQLSGYNFTIPTAITVG